MAYLGDDEIEAEATELRKMMGLPGDTPLKWSDLVSRLERTFPGIRLLDIPDEEMPLGPAEADTRNNRIKFRQSAYNQLCKGSVWALEVLAHELGHFKLNHDGGDYSGGCETAIA